MYVGKNLFKHSIVFMGVIFNDRAFLANATNRLFEMGFFLLAFGIAFYNLKEYGEITTYRDLFEKLSDKAGAYTIFLGVLLMFNLFLYFRGMKRRTPSTTNN